MGQIRAPGPSWCWELGSWSGEGQCHQKDCAKQDLRFLIWNGPHGCAVRLGWSFGGEEALRRCGERPARDDGGLDQALGSGHQEKWVLSELGGSFIKN